MTLLRGILKPGVTGCIPALLSRVTTSGTDMQPKTGAWGSSTMAIVPRQAELGGSRGWTLAHWVPEESHSTIRG